MKKTAFYKAAERCASGIEDNRDGCCYGVCHYLFDPIVGIPPSGDVSDKYFFIRYFKPTESEGDFYNTHPEAWMYSLSQSDDQNRQDRVIALLFADQMWKDGIR